MKEKRRLLNANCPTFSKGTTLNIRSRTVCLRGLNYVFVYYLYQIYLLPLNSCSLPRWSVGPQWKWRLLNANCPTFSRGPPNMRGLTVFSFASTKSTENMQYCRLLILISEVIRLFLLIEQSVSY